MLQFKNKLSPPKTKSKQPEIPEIGKAQLLNINQGLVPERTFKLNPQQQVIQQKPGIQEKQINPLTFKKQDAQTEQLQQQEILQNSSNPDQQVEPAQKIDPSQQGEVQDALQKGQKINNFMEEFAFVDQDPNNPMSLSEREELQKIQEMHNMQEFEQYQLEDGELPQDKPFKIIYSQQEYQKEIELMKKKNLNPMELEYEIVEESQILQLIEENHLQAERLMEDDNTLESFFILKRMELLIDTYVKGGGKIASEIMLCVYNNLAYVYSKQLSLDKTLEYLDKAFTYINKYPNKKMTSRATSSHQYAMQRRQKRNVLDPKQYYAQKQRLRLYMAKAIVYSEMNNHKEALVYSKLCVQIISLLWKQFYVSGIYQIHKNIFNSSNSVLPQKVPTRSTRKKKNMQNIYRFRQQYNPGKGKNIGSLMQSNRNFDFMITNSQEKQLRNSQRNFTAKRNLSQGLNRPQPKVGNFTKTAMYGSKAFQRNSSMKQSNIQESKLTMEQQKVHDEIKNSLPIIKEFIKRSERTYNMTDNKHKSEVINYRMEVEKYFTFMNQKEATLNSKQFNLSHWMDQLPQWHWVYETNIISVLEINYLRLSEIYRQSKTNYYQFIQDEFSIDAIYEKLFLQIVCCYCTATEIRFIQEEALEEAILTGKKEEVKKLKQQQTSSESPLPESQIQLFQNQFFSVKFESEKVWSWHFYFYHMHHLQQVKY